MRPLEEDDTEDLRERDCAICADFEFGGLYVLTLTGVVFIVRRGDRFAVVGIRVLVAGSGILLPVVTGWFKTGGAEYLADTALESLTGGQTRLADASRSFSDTFTFSIRK